MSKLKESLFIVIEGIDGSGKSTQCKLLKEVFDFIGFDVASYREPTTRSHHGKNIKRGYYGTLVDFMDFENEGKMEYTLFMEDRKINVEKNIKPRLENKYVVILDRYYFSTIAYQGAKGLSPEHIKKENEKLFPKPDITIILDIDPEITIERVKNNRNDTPNRYERVEYLKKVRKLYKEMESYENVEIINTEKKSIDEIFIEILHKIKPIFKEKKSKRGV